MLWRTPTAILLALASGCGHYDLKVNERVVYSPRPPFTDYALADPALQACVAQTIAERRIAAAAELSELNCSHAGIASLDGLEVFTGLVQLKLSANQIRNLVPLAQLSALEILLLDDNAAVDPVPLYELPALQTLDLRGNPALQCPGGNALFTLDALYLPEHCEH